MTVLSIPVGNIVINRYRFKNHFSVNQQFIKSSVAEDDEDDTGETGKSFA